MIAANNLEPGEPENTGGLGAGSELLSDPYQITRDAKLIARAVRNGWGVTEKEPIVQRLYGIVEKESVACVDNQGGVFDNEGLADKNAIAAARVLVQMNGQDQADEHVKIAPKAGQMMPTNVTVGVQVVNGTEVKRLRPEEMDQDYVEFVRQRMLASSSESSSNDVHNQSRPMENGSAPDGDRPSVN